MNYWIKNVFFAENDGLLFGIDIVPYSINKLLKLYWIQMQMGGSYAMEQHAEYNGVP